MAHGTVFKASNDTFHETIKTFKEMETLMKGLQNSVLFLANKLSSYQNQKDFDKKDHQYVKAYNQIKFFIHGGRQELKILAYTTISKTNEIKQLVEGLEKYDHDTAVFLFRVGIDSLKTLLEHTMDKTDKTRNNYNKALRVMDEVQTNARIALAEMAKAKRKYKDDINWDGCFYATMISIFGCAGKCTASCNGEVTTGEELDIIIDWETRAENLDDKLKDKIYSVKLLKMFIPLKNIFIRKLQKLQDVAQMFINQPESLFD